MEQYITIPTSGGFEINGVLNSKEKSKELIIFVHGFHGSMNHHIFHNGARFFTQNGYDTFRWNLYGDGEKNRRLHECDFTTHGKDIDIIIELFEKDYENIILIGHSFGGLSLTYAKLMVLDYVFWEPSVSVGDENFDDLEDIGKYYLSKRGIRSYTNKDMFTQYKDESINRYKNFKGTIKIILAGKSPLPSKWEGMKGEINHIQKIHIIGKANHSYDEQGAEEELFEKTLEFIEK